MICLNSAGNLVRSEVGKKNCVLRFVPTHQQKSQGACENPSHVPVSPHKWWQEKKAQQRPSQTQLGSLHLKPRSFSSAEPPGIQRASYDGPERWREPPAMGRTSPTLRRAWPRDGPLAAICVQNVDVQCVLQFTLIHAAGCVLHRRTSRVIHRLKLSFILRLRSSLVTSP